MKGEDLIHFIKKRRSIRKYTKDPVTDEQVKTMLEAAMAAPSGSDKRPWEFVVVRDEKLRAALSKVKKGAHMCVNSPVVFAVLGDDIASIHWHVDAAAATENILLAAVALGLGAVWIGVYPRDPHERGVREILGIPGHRRVLSMIAVGHPAEEKPAHTKYDEARIHHDRYGRK
ncbi:MAG: nitroreductase family protein [Planctomycetota bacterium]|jgi:nitroreductase